MIFVGMLKSNGKKISRGSLALWSDWYWFKCISIDATEKRRAQNKKKRRETARAESMHV